MSVAWLWRGALAPGWGGGVTCPWCPPASTTYAVYLHVVIAIYTYHCRVTESKYDDFAVGELIVARIGWQSHTIANAALVEETWMSKIDPSLPFSPSTAIGVLGMPG